MYQLCYAKVYSTNQYENLIMLDDPGRVRSKITRLTVDLVSFYYGYIELCMAACPRTVFVGDGHLNLKYPEFKHVTRRHFVIVILEKKHNIGIVFMRFVFLRRVV